MLIYWKTHIVKMPIFPRQIYRFSAIPVKIPAVLYIGKLILNFKWKGKGIGIAKTIFKKNKIGKSHNTVQSRQRDIDEGINQWNKTVQKQTHPHMAN